MISEPTVFFRLRLLFHASTVRAVPRLVLHRGVGCGEVTPRHCLEPCQGGGSVLCLVSSLLWVL